jgi:hypothetical protein
MFSILDNFALPADEILLELKPLMKSMKKKTICLCFYMLFVSFKIN